MTLVRLDNWPRLLSEAVEIARLTPFRWGIHDCALFAVDLVRAITGTDLGTAVRGRYQDAQGAAEVMIEVFGTARLDEVVTQLLGEPIAVTLAQRGDVVLLDVIEGPALGVCLGMVAVGAGPTGTVMVPMEKWVKAWRV